MTRTRGQDSRTDRARVLLARERLDAEIASGLIPEAEPLRALRAHQLTARRMRDRLARSLESLVALSERARPGLSAAVPIRRREVRSARPALLRTAKLLRSEDEIDPRGVALLLELLADGASAIYNARADRRLEHVARRVMFALEMG
jgi:hypothetical protein